MTQIPDMLTTLRTLDPADPNTDPDRPHARATLERILATDPGQHPDHTPVKPRSRRGIRVAAVASATAVTAGAALVVLPSLTGGDTAFATWTATPSGMSTQAAADVAADCRDSQLDGPGADHTQDLRHADVAIAERRGEWTLVALTGDDGFSALCITDQSTPLFRDWIGSIGSPADYAAPGPHDVVATSLGTGIVNNAELSLAEGYVGSDVTGVVYRSASHGEVEATVSGGRFALWMPGDELEHAARAGIDVQATYTDGSTATIRLDLR